MLVSKIVLAWRGRAFWLQCLRQFGAANCAVVAFPDEDEALNVCALRHVDDLLAYHKLPGAIIVTSVPAVAGAVENNVRSPAPVWVVPPKKMDALLAYYELCAFSEDFFLVSLRRPAGNKAWEAVGVHGITLEEVVCLALFRIRNLAATGLATEPLP